MSKAQKRPAQEATPATPPVQRGIPEARPAPATRPLAAGATGRAPSEDQVRLCAYLKWEAAGRPAGDSLRFWLEAERELRGRASR